MLPVMAKMLNEGLGTVLCGSWINVCLFTFETLSVIRYFSRFTTDLLWIRTLVVSMYTVSIAATVNNSVMLYMYCVVNYGNIPAVLKQDITWPITVMTIAASVFLLHAFLLYRYARLSRRLIVTAFLALCPIAQLVAASALAVQMSRYTSVFDRPKFKDNLVAWLAASATSDILIAIVLIWELRRIKTSFKKMESLLWRLIGHATMSGAVTALLGSVALLTYFLKPQANYCAMISIPIGRICTMTVIYNLNVRGSGGTTLGAGASQEAGPDTVVAWARPTPAGTVLDGDTGTVGRRSIIPRVEATKHERGGENQLAMVSFLQADDGSGRSRQESPGKHRLPELEPLEHTAP